MVKKYIYADNAATSKLSEAALDAMLPFYKDIYANPSQLYSFSREAKKQLMYQGKLLQNVLEQRRRKLFLLLVEQKVIIL